MPSRLMLIPVVLIGWAAFAEGGEPQALLEVSIGRDRWLGRIAAHDDMTCWMLRQDGSLKRFATDDVTDFREVESRFRPFTALDLRDRLNDEFGRDFEVRTTQRYVVVATRNQAERYAALFDSIYRQFHLYFTARGFRMSEPEFPLMAIVLPDQTAFYEYCLAEGTRPSPGLVGFYLPGSNRVALYDRESSGGSSDDVDHTIIHEATHQVAFNTGIHSRIGKSPLWLVEGLATMFEAEGIRRPVAAGGSAWTRINTERWTDFQKLRGRRPTGWLKEFVESDSLFRTSVLDAYGQGWALTFYLAESRPTEFARYLKRVASRNPLVDYSATERLADFQAEFGRDLLTLESGLLGFFDRFEATHAR